MKSPATFWTNHLTAALAMLRFTPSRMTGLPPFAIATGRMPQLLSLSARPLPKLHGAATPAEEEDYYAAFANRV